MIQGITEIINYVKQFDKTLEYYPNYGQFIVGIIKKMDQINDEFKNIMIKVKKAQQEDDAQKQKYLKTEISILEQKIFNIATSLDQEISSSNLSHHEVVKDLFPEGVPEGIKITEKDDFSLPSSLLIANIIVKKLSPVLKYLKSLKILFSDERLKDKRDQEEMTDNLKKLENNLGKDFDKDQLKYILDHSSNKALRRDVQRRLALDSQNAVAFLAKCSESPGLQIFIKIITRHFKNVYKQLDKRYMFNVWPELLYNTCTLLQELIWLQEDYKIEIPQPPKK
jgi:hypothetical protein